MITVPFLQMKKEAHGSKEPKPQILPSVLDSVSSHFLYLYLPYMLCKWLQTAHQEKIIAGI